MKTLSTNVCDIMEKKKTKMRKSDYTAVWSDSVYDFVRSFKSDFFSQTWTDVSKNSSKTAKNTEKWFSQNISGEMC